MPPKKRVRTPEEEAAREERQRIQVIERMRRYRERLAERNRERNEERAQENATEFEQYRQERCREILRRCRNNREIIPVIGGEHYLGPMDVNCTHCNAKHFSAERVSNKGDSFNDCCSHGAVRLEKLPEYLEQLRSLIDGSHEKSKFFF